MSKKINIMETSIAVSLSSDKAQRDLKKLRDQIKDAEKSENVVQRRQEKRQQRAIQSMSRKAKIGRETQARQIASLKAQEALQKRLASRKAEENRNDLRAARQKARVEAEAARRRARDAKLASRNEVANHRRRLAALKVESNNLRNQHRAYQVNQAYHSRRLNAGLSKTGETMGSVGRGFAGTAAAVGIGGTVAAMNPARTWENAYNALYTDESRNGKEGALERTNVLSEKIYQMAAGMGIANPEQLLDAFVQLRPLSRPDNVTGEASKYTDDDILHMVATMTQGAKAMGTDAATFDRFMLGFRQFAANINAGTASGQEIGQMRDASASLANAFFEAMGFSGNITPDEAARLTQSGELNIDRIMEAMPKLMDMTKHGYERQRNFTLQGSIDSFMVALNHMGRMFGEGAKSGIVKGLKTMGAVMMENEDIIKRMGVWVGDSLSSLADGIRDMADAWNNMTPERQQAMIDGILLAGKIALAMGVLGTAISIFYKVIKPLVLIFGALVGLKLGAVGAAIGAIAGLIFLFHHFKDSILSVFETISQVVGMGLDKIKSGVSSVFGGEGVKMSSSSIGGFGSSLGAVGNSYSHQMYQYGANNVTNDNKNVTVNISNKDVKGTGREVGKVLGIQGNY